MYFWHQRRSNFSSPRFTFDSKDVRVFLRRVLLLPPQTGGCFSACVLLIYFWRQRLSSFSLPRFTSGATDGRVFLRPPYTSGAKDVIYFWRQRWSNFSLPRFTSDAKDVRVFLRRVLLLAPQTGGCFSACVLLLAPKARSISGANDGRVFLCRVSLLAPQTGGCFSARLILLAPKTLYFWRQRRSNFSSRRLYWRIGRTPTLRSFIFRKSRGLYAGKYGSLNNYLIN